MFRVDHFLGKSTTLNVLGARFANRILEPLWSAESVESVSIVYDEKLGLEGRAGYYDGAGALVDMIQSHLLQVLAVVAMEQPATIIEAADFREATSAVVRATRVWDDDPVASSRRGRYTSGSIDDIEKPSYVDEPGVDPARWHRDALAAVGTFEVRNARWSGVPFTNCVPARPSATPPAEIVVTFRAVRHVPEGLRGTADRAVLRFSLGPDLMSLELNLNGADRSARPRTGDAVRRPRTGPAHGIRRGALRHPRRRPDAVRSWGCCRALLADRAADPRRPGRNDEIPLEEYQAGSHGPAAWPFLA